MCAVAFRAECEIMKSLLQGRKKQSLTLKLEFDISLKPFHWLNHHIFLIFSVLSEVLSDVFSSVSHLIRFVYQLG